MNPRTGASRLVGTRRSSLGAACQTRRLLLPAISIIALFCLLAATASAKTVATKPTLIIDGGCSGAEISGDPTDSNLMNTSTNLHALLSNPVGSVTPSLATKWKVFPGNKKIELWLRHGIAFDDGEPFNAQAVATWIGYLNKLHSVWSPIGVATTHVVNKYALTVSFTTPSSSIPWGFAFETGVLAPYAVKQLEANPNSDVLSKQNYGIGPYIWDSSHSVIGDHCVYVPNPHWYNKSQQKWGEIVVKTVSDPNATLAALRTGAIDFAQGTPQTAAAAAAAGLKVLSVPGGGDGFFGLLFLDHSGKTVPALKDVRVRQALNYAIDRKTITDALFDGYAVPTSIPNYGTEGQDPKYVNYYSYNPAKAKALLAAAGYAKGFTVPVVGGGGWDPQIDDMAEAVCKYLAAVNVNCNITHTDTWTEYNNDTTSSFGLYTVPLGNWPMSFWYRIVMQPGAQLADKTGWWDPTIVKLADKAQRAPINTANSLWRQISDRAVKDADFLPVSSDFRLYFYNPAVIKHVAVSGYSHAFPSEWTPAVSAK